MFKTEFRNAEPWIGFRFFYPKLQLRSLSPPAGRGTG